MRTVKHTPYVRLELNDNLLIATYKKGLCIDLAIARKIVNSRKRFTEHRTYPAMIMDYGVISMTRDARLFFSSKSGTEGLSASALVFRTMYGACMGRFFLLINKPQQMPVRVFATEKGALRWLEQYIA